jgi:hypothetical protein
MPYFHVVVKSKNNKKPLCIFKDLSEKELKNKFVKPYKLNKSFFYYGNILTASELVNIKIVSTLQKHEQELKQELPVAHLELIKKAEEFFKDIEEFNALDSDNVDTSVDTYNDYEIQDCGVDVTHKFIREAPGEGTTLSKFSEILRHPWVVRIFAVFLTFTLIYLGIK